MAFKKVDFEEIRDQVAAYLSEELTGGHIVTTDNSASQQSNNEVEKAIVLVTYGGFTNTPGPGTNASCFDFDNNLLQIRITPPIVTNKAEGLNLLYRSGAEVVNVLRDKSKMTSPPFGNPRIVLVKVIAGTLGDAPSQGGINFYIIVGIDTTTS